MRILVAIAAPCVAVVLAACPRDAEAPKVVDTAASTSASTTASTTPRGARYVCGDAGDDELDGRCAADFDAASDAGASPPVWCFDASVTILMTFDCSRGPNQPATCADTKPATMGLCFESSARCEEARAKVKDPNTSYRWRMQQRVSTVTSTSACDAVEPARVDGGVVDGAGL